MSDSADLGRTPPRGVLTQLRQEVRFHCPVPTEEGICGNPYLTWHHFDPPWRVEKHHRVEGMIALCRQHADKADNGSFTNDQLRRFKTEAISHEDEIKGRFDWMRNDLIAYVGGNFYTNTLTIIEIDGSKAVWFERNEHGELMLSYEMPPVSSKRTHILSNVWHVDQEDVQEIVAPPGGRTLTVAYTNGDKFAVEFREVRTPEDFIRRFPASAIHAASVEGLDYPATVASITDVQGSRSIALYPNRTVIESAFFENAWFNNVRVAISINTTPESGLTVEQNAAVAAALDRFNTR